MTVLQSQSRLPSDVAPPDEGADGRLSILLLLASVIAVAIALRHTVAANTDVSWLLTVGEKVLSGQRLYTDILETNPPIAVLAYLPSVVLGRLLHVRPETVTDALLFIGIALSMLVSVRILRKTVALDNVRGGPLLAFCLAVLTIVPMQSFGQREHLAFVAFLPALAAYAVRAADGRLPVWAIVAAGVGAGITLDFKPYFILGIGAGIAMSSFYARSWRTLFAPENIIAAAIVVATSIGIAAFYPDYFTLIYPLVRDVYLQLKMPLPLLLGSIGMLAWACAMILALLMTRPRKPDATLAVLLATSLGFAAAYVLQRKGWSYQSYPMLALALMAAAYALASQTQEASRTTRRGGLISLVVVFLLGAMWMNDASSARALEQPVAQLGPHPRILMLSAEASIGHPLVRSVGGEWVSRQQGLWAREFVKRMRQDRAVDPQTDARLNTYLARERAGLIEDITRQRPDVILIDNLLSDWGNWLRTDAELSALLKPYRLATTVQKIDILKRTGE